MLKSLIRMDEDQSARRIMLKFLNVVDNDYYEFTSEFLERLAARLCFRETRVYGTTSVVTF